MFTIRVGVWWRDEIGKRKRHVEKRKYTERKLGRMPLKL